MPVHCEEKIVTQVVWVSVTQLFSPIETPRFELEDLLMSLSLRRGFWG